MEVGFILYAHSDRLGAAAVRQRGKGPGTGSQRRVSLNLMIVVGGLERGDVCRPP